jgi:hypothetical protein
MVMEWDGWLVGEGSGSFPSKLNSLHFQNRHTTSSRLVLQKSLAEEIRRMTGEGIETLQFAGDKIISQGREGESINFCEW